MFFGFAICETIEHYSRILICGIGIYNRINYNFFGGESVLFFCFLTAVLTNKLDFIF